LNREEKAREIADLHENFRKAKAVIFTDFTGLKVEEINELRRKLKAASVNYIVIKNTLARRACEGTSLEIIRDKFIGPLGVAISFSDSITAPKALTDFIKDKGKLKIKFGIVEGKAVDPKEIKAIADLPTKEVMLSSLLSGLQSPTRKMAGLLYQLIARFGYALKAVLENKTRISKS
jgi:large subunit ribosomal protein L10